MMMQFNPPVIGHRGACAYAPENTMPSFLKAKELGVKWIEFDIQLTADGELVVFHDLEMSRTTNGQGEIQYYPLNYLKTLDVGGWFNSSFKGTIIPTLQDMITFAQQQDIALNIEIKMIGTDPVLMAEKVSTLLEKNLKKKNFQFLLSSFNPIVLKKLREINSTLPLGYLKHEWSEDWQEVCEQLNCSVIGLNCEIVTEELVRKIRAKDCLVLVYTVNDPILAAMLFSWGVSAVFSDCPDKIINVG